MVGLSSLFTLLKVNDAWYGSDFYHMSVILLVSVYADSQSCVAKKISQKVEGQLSKSQNFFCASMLAFSHHLFAKCKCRGTGAILIIELQVSSQQFSMIDYDSWISLWALIYFGLDLESISFSSLGFHIYIHM